MSEVERDPFALPPYLQDQGPDEERHLIEPSCGQNRAQWFSTVFDRIMLITMYTMCVIAVLAFWAGLAAAVAFVGASVFNGGAI